eukprot:1194904-Prorocentrum_minimum.AAC.3
MADVSGGEQDGGPSAAPGLVETALKFDPDAEALAQEEANKAAETDSQVNSPRARHVSPSRRRIDPFRRVVRGVVGFKSTRTIRGGVELFGGEAARGRGRGGGDEEAVCARRAPNARLAGQGESRRALAIFEAAVRDCRAGS